MRRKLVFFGAASALIAFLVQAMYESPLSVFVPYVSYVGGRVSWAIHMPNYSNNASVWLFDSIAIIVNGMVYFLIIYLLDQIISLVRRGRLGRTEN
jgi:hypothetical protein